MAEIENWNDPGKDMRAIMMRSASGRRLLAMEREDLERRFKEKTRVKTVEKQQGKAEKRAFPGRVSQSFGAILADLTRCAGFSDPITRMISNDAEGVLVRSGVPTSAAGFFLPLSDERRAITDRNAPLGEFVAAFNRALDDHLLLAKLGVTRLPNLAGSSKVAEYSGSVAGWKGDTEAATNGKGTFSKVAVTPHRLTAYLNVSRMELAQNPGLSTFLANDLAQSVAEAIERAVFGNEPHSDNKPDGFFTGDGVRLADITDATYSSILNIEGSVRNNGMPMAWAMNTRCEIALKKTPRNAGSIIAGGLCSDRPYLVSDLLAGEEDGEGRLVFGRWSDFILASWGAMEIIYNPYTQAVNGQATFIINFYTDWTWKRNSFMAAKGSIG